MRPFSKSSWAPAVSPFAHPAARRLLRKGRMMPSPELKATRVWLVSQFEYVWVVVGSGFGGAVSALRLAEKGYSVNVLECGKRFRDEDFPKSTWDLRRYFWAPRIGMKGIFRLTQFRDVAVVSGCGVGGGSLGYANTLYVPGTDFFG